MEIAFSPTRARLTGWPGMVGVQGRERAKTIHFGKIETLSTTLVKNSGRAEATVWPNSVQGFARRDGDTSLFFAAGKEFVLKA